MKKLLILCPFLLISSVESATYLVKIKDVTKTNIIKTEEYRNWNSSSSTFTEWLNFNAAYNMSLYNPKIVDQVEDFIQTQTFKQDQQQFEQKREYDTVKKVYKNIGDPIETQQTLSLENTKEVTVIANDWLSVGVPKDCATWNPDISSVVYGDEFTQSRQCSQDKNRTIEYYIDASLDSTLLFDQTFLLIENQQAFGSNTSTGWILADSTFTDWADVSVGYDYLAWYPSINNQLTNFVQNRDYSQDQNKVEQKREQNSFTLSYRDLGMTIEHDQTITNNENRNIVVAINTFTNNNIPYGCTNWTPTVDSIVYGVTFDQNRNCNQDQIANVSYQVDSTEIDSGTTEKTIVIGEINQETGTNDSSGWVTHTSIFSSWINEGVEYSQTAYSPIINNQLVNFVQTRGYKQDQTQNEQLQEINTFTNAIRNDGAIIKRDKTLNENENRNITTIIAVFSDNGNHYNCGSTWSPNTSTKIYGTTFTQTRSCKQNQDAIVTYKEGSTIIETGLTSKVINENETQEATGTNDSSGWTVHTSTYSGWVNSGSSYGHSAYSPAPSSQTSNFNQSRNYYQKQVNNEQPREINTFTNTIRNNGSVIVKEQTLTPSETRLITVANTGWSTTRSNYNCGSYSPSTSSYYVDQRFLQTRDCVTDQKLTYTYKYSSTLLHSKNYYRTIAGGTSRYIYGSEQRPFSATYGCPSGWTESSNSSRCYTSVVPYDNGCPSGYIRTNGLYQCANYINMSYSCPSGAYLSGSTCYP